MSGSREEEGLVEGEEMGEMRCVERVRRRGEVRGRSSLDSGYHSPSCPPLPTPSPHHLDVSL